MQRNFFSPPRFRLPDYFFLQSLLPTLLRLLSRIIRYYNDFSLLDGHSSFSAARQTTLLPDLFLDTLFAALLLSSASHSHHQIGRNHQSDFLLAAVHIQIQPSSLPKKRHDGRTHETSSACLLAAAAWATSFLLLDSCQPAPLPLCAAPTTHSRARRPVFLPPPAQIGTTSAEQLTPRTLHTLFVTPH